MSSEISGVDQLDLMTMRDFNRWAKALGVPNIRAYRQRQQRLRKHGRCKRWDRRRYR